MFCEGKMAGRMLLRARRLRYTCGGAAQAAPFGRAPEAGAGCCCRSAQGQPGTPYGLQKHMNEHGTPCALITRYLWQKALPAAHLHTAHGLAPQLRHRADAGLDLANCEEGGTAGSAKWQLTVKRHGIGSC